MKRQLNFRGILTDYRRTGFKHPYHSDGYADFGDRIVEDADVVKLVKKHLNPLYRYSIDAIVAAALEGFALLASGNIPEDDNWYF